MIVIDPSDESERIARAVFDESDSVLSVKEKLKLRQYFNNKADWKRHIREVSRIYTEQLTQPQERERFQANDDFLANALCFLGTARKRKQRRALKERNRKSRRISR